MAYGDYGAVSAGTSLGDYGEAMSLLLIVASFLMITYLAVRIRTRRSFQFEIFIFSLVLVFSEVPRILDTLRLLDVSSIADLGLGIHTVAMIILTLYVALRTYRFFRG